MMEIYFRVHRNNAIYLDHGSLSGHIIIQNFQDACVLFRVTNLNKKNNYSQNSNCSTTHKSAYIHSVQFICIFIHFDHIRSLRLIFPYTLVYLMPIQVMQYNRKMAVFSFVSFRDHRVYCCENSEAETLNMHYIQTSLT